MKTRVALLASIFSLCLVAFVAAQVSTTTGTVVSNSGGVLVVDTASGQRSFMVDAQSSVPADLAAGARVTVEYHTLANDKFHAFKVTPSSGTAPTMGTGTTGTTGSTPATSTTAPSMQERPTTTASPSMQERPTTTASPSMQERPATPTTGTTTGTLQDRPTTTGNDTTSAPPADTTGTMADDRSTTRELPATASPLPLLALAGSLALAGGALLRRRRA
jgi:LPXTG-motif cell wall-anchored protein